MTEIIREIVGYTLTALGAFFYFLAGLGLIRMPDVYTKLQASTKATTLGTFSIALGIGILNPEFFGKSIILIAFVALTNPVASSVMIRAAYKNNAPACKETCIDEIAELKNNAVEKAVTGGEGNE
ncbi:MAG: monovalent cation/H(+) antiporter subunit G [Fervidobacterium sp.]|jgi:multicomponent Na+:H+ antiporter subunit G|uniref:Membrane bound protein complex subunit mbxC n=1 Tax=Fervidobacterium gondwanense DSM 13020 TaxID=1121883 RepID=A0A1M7RXD0_FERGO|nr:monovalent cation/H(+) antiporter subunit G [Fervidobacterium gondwanense]UXF00062.1 cation:proton antiporter [Fervidobacterium riparium]SHN50692.1 Membrane bound protein complex subunit mbxC [Fervidobacterium gondwanense DSM 13020]